MKLTDSKTENTRNGNASSTLSVECRKAGVASFVPFSIREIRTTDKKESRISDKIFTAKNAKNTKRRTYDVSSLPTLRSLWFNSFWLRLAALGNPWWNR